MQETNTTENKTHLKVKQNTKQNKIILTISKIWVSLESLLRIRPAGVVSKNL